MAASLPGHRHGREGEFPALRSAGRHRSDGDPAAAANSSQFFHAPQSHSHDILPRCRRR